MSAKKKAKYEDIMAAKKAIMAAKKAGATPSVQTFGSGGSRAMVKVKLLGSPTTVAGKTHVDAYVLKVTEEEGDGGFMHLPTAKSKAALLLAPLTDNKGGYLFETKEFKPTDKRKPVTLADCRVVKLVINDPPKVPGAPWALAKELYPGNVIELKNAAVHSVFRDSTHLTGTYSPTTDAVLASTEQPLDMEIPFVAFQTVAEDTKLILRNIMISSGTPSLKAGWEELGATNPAKQAIVTAHENERNSLLSSNGQWMTSMEEVAKNGDAIWSKDVKKIIQEMANGAPFCTEGFGWTPKYDTDGSTILVSVHALGRNQTLTDGMPGEKSNAYAITMEEDGTQPVSFEATLCLPEDKTQFRAFGGSFKKKEPTRANGGPWIETPFKVFAKLKEASGVVDLGTYTPLLSLAAMPVHLGSKVLSMIGPLCQSLLPMVNMVIGLNPDATKTETMNCWVAAADVHTALVENGIEVDEEMILTMFEDAPILEEDKDVAKTLQTKPKELLACGFVLLNENENARKKEWLDKQKDQMEKILAHGNRKEKVKITMRAINPLGFEQHKESLEKLSEVDLDNRLEHVDVDWPIYAVLETYTPPEAGSDETPLADDDEEDFLPPPDTTAKNKRGDASPEGDKPAKKAKS